MSGLTDRINPLDTDFLNTSASQIMRSSLGEEGNHTIKDLAQTASWKGKVIQWFRSLVGKEITAEKNTIMLREGYGELSNASKSIESSAIKLDTILVQMRAMRGRLKNKDQKLEESIKQYHWENPKDSSEKLKTLEKHTANLANATALLCHECSEGSKRTNDFVEEMQKNKNVFNTASLVIRDMRSKIEESEKIVGKLRKIEKQDAKQLKNKLLDDGHFYNDFARFHFGAEKEDRKLTNEEASEFMNLIAPYATKESNAVLMESFKNFINDRSKKIIEEGKDSEIAAAVRSYKI